MSTDRDHDVVAGANRELALILAQVAHLADSVRQGRKGLESSDPVGRQATLSMAVSMIWPAEAMQHVIAAMIINSVETDIKDISGIYGNPDIF